jgi:hypothetical protein
MPRGAIRAANLIPAEGGGGLAVNWPGEIAVHLVQSETTGRP